MAELTGKSVREKLILFVQRRGYGAMKSVADASGITASYLIKFRKGDVDVEKKTLIAINTGIESLLDQEPSIFERASEEPATYAVLSPDVNPFDVMASDFESIAKRLRSPAYDPAAKIRHLRKWLTDVQADVEAFAAKLKANPPRATSKRK